MCRVRGIIAELMIDRESYEQTKDGEVIRPRTWTNGVADESAGSRYVDVKGRICRSNVLGVVMHGGMNIHSVHIKLSGV